MDADILRLILFIAGIALIIGIYFWDRHKKINVRINAIHKAERVKRESETEENRQEPVWEKLEEPEPLPRAAQPEPALDETLRELGQLVQEEGAGKHTRPNQGSGEQAAFEFGSEEETAGSGVSAAGKPVPTKILQLNVMARSSGFGGDALMLAARDLQLEPGEMQIFHRYDEQRNDAPTLFSMASMVEPGSFPFASMQEFNTPGVTLFAQLPGPRDGIQLFELMHETALRLAALLDGEVLDGSRSVLSKQTLEHLREEIREHSRLVRLARSH